jgi:hypothetical protein
MRNAPALLLLTAAVAAGAAEPPAPAPTTSQPKAHGRPADTPKAGGVGAVSATSCSSGAAGATSVAAPAPSKAPSAACTFDMGSATPRSDPHADQKGKSAPTAARARGAATVDSHTRPGTDAATAPAQAKDKPPARP